MVFYLEYLDIISCDAIIIDHYVNIVWPILAIQVTYITKGTWQTRQSHLCPSDDIKYIHTFKNSIKTVKGLDCAQPTLDTPLDDNGHKEPVKEKFPNNIDMKVILPFHGSDNPYIVDYALKNTKYTIVLL